MVKDMIKIIIEKLKVQSKLIAFSGTPEEYVKYKNKIKRRD